MAVTRVPATTHAHKPAHTNPRAPPPPAGNRGAKLLADALPSLPSLRHLVLTANNVGDAGAEALAGAVTSSRTLCRWGGGAVVVRWLLWCLEGRVDGTPS